MLFLYSFGNPIPKKRGWFAILTKEHFRLQSGLLKKLPSSGAGLFWFSHEREAT